ncbi:MAG: diacylglycerol/lipid kinase family protein [Sphingomicrobium sp.]
MDALTLVNRAGGGEDDSEDRRARTEAALAGAGIVGPVELVDGADLRDRAGQAVTDGVPLLVIGGGDGSVSTAAGEAAGTGTRLGILPMGTLNHFARDLGIPLDLDQAARLIASGAERRVDVGMLGERAFINNLAIGLYPLMLVDREGQQRRLGRSKRLAMLVASLRTMRRFHAQRLILTIDGGEARTETPLLFVGNNAYHLALPGAGRRDALDQGRLCVVVMRSKGVPGFLAATVRALVGLGRPEDMEQWEAQNLRVDSSSKRLTVAIDGESATVETPFDISIRPRALNVIAPL